MNNVEKIKPSGIFTNYIYKAIPLAFDESMSYYETLCGVLSLLKTQEEVINNNADLLAELELYVKNYFTNLDVQTEINNKLDEMAENGQLAEIIAQFLQLKAIFTFDNVKEMTEATYLTNGLICKTMGFYNFNDGGSALYKIRTITNQDVINNINLFAILNDNTLVAELIENSYRNIKQYGAKGDNTNNDTNSFKVALASNINLFIPKGIYLINEELTLLNDSSIYGESERDTILKSNSTLDSLIRLSKSNCGLDTTEATEGISISNLTIDATGCTYGIYANYLTNESKLENITVINATKCNICMLKLWFSKFINLTAKDGFNNGIEIGVQQNEEDDCSVNAIDFINLRAHNNGRNNTHNQTDNILKGCGILIGKCNTCNFDMIQSEANIGIGLILDSYFVNNFNAIYLENNSKNQTNKYSLYQTNNSTSGQLIGKISFQANQTALINSNISFDCVSRNDSIRTFYGNGTIYANYLENQVISNQTDFTNIAFRFLKLFEKRNINLRYGSQLTENFINGENIGYPFMILVPKSSLTSTSSLNIRINDTNYNIGTQFTENQFIIKRLSAFNNTNHINTIVTTTGVSADLYFDVYIGYFAYGTKNGTLPNSPISQS